MGLAVDEIYADRAVLIPELLTGLPYSFFSTSAIDAFIHAIESYVSPKATLYTQMFSMKAMEMIIEGFQKIAEHGEEYRMNLLDDFLTASNLAGIAFGNAGTGHTWRSELSVPDSCIRKISGIRSKWQNKETK